MVPSAAIAAPLLLLLAPRAPPLQQPDTGSQALRYEPVFEALRRMTPRSDRVAAVRDLTLRRDAIELRLAEGQLALLTPVAGRTVGAVFVGRGTLSFVPPLGVERAQLDRMLGDSLLATPISGAVLLFADSTLAELERRLGFGPGTVAGDAARRVDDALDRVTDRRTWQADATFMSALLNADSNGFFSAYLRRERGEDLFVAFDPARPEPVLLRRRGRWEGQRLQTVCQFPRTDVLRGAAPPDSAPEPVRVEGYRIEATIGADVDFSATAEIRVTARRAGIRWVPFRLFEELEVDSVAESSGARDSFFRAKRGGELWVRLAAPLGAGERAAIRVSYHGGLITARSLVEDFERRWTASLPLRTADSLRQRMPPPTDRWFFLQSTTAWFPRYGALGYGSRQAADMDLTFHTPARYRLASIGRLVESYVEGDVRTTRWATERPTNTASFNIGEFAEHEITDPRIPPVTVHMNAEGHRRLNELFLGQRDPQQTVTADLVNSLSFFTQVFGPPLFQRYYATEIPYPRGEAFPGLIHLSVWTFQTVNESGAEESFRAHEMAHQWWGIGVEPESYRDAWLSEGFAEFAGLWYMQAILHDNEKYFTHLRDWRRELRDRRDAALPTGLGTRVAEANPGDYFLMIYRKGAWLLHMVRNLFLDYRTMREDAFAALMRDFYREYRGGRASTADFQRAVERHLGMSMDWFFSEWVDGTAIPTYAFAWRADTAPDGAPLLRLRIRQEDVPEDFQMLVPARIALADGHEAFVRILVRGPLTERSLRLPAAATGVELNPLESVLAEVKPERWPAP